MPIFLIHNKLAMHLITYAFMGKVEKTGGVIDKGKAKPDKGVGKKIVSPKPIIYDISAGY